MAKNKENRIKEVVNKKISLYNIKGEKIGELLPGGKVNFDILLSKDKNKKRYTKKVVNYYGKKI